MAAQLALASLLALLCIAQPGLSRPEQAASPNLEQMFLEIKNSISNTINEAQKSLKLPEPNGEAVVKMMKENVNKAEANLKEMREQIEKKMKDDPQMQEVLKNLKAKLDEAAANIKKQNPEMAAGAQKAMDEMKTGYENMVKEMERIHAEVNKKGGMKDDMENLMKGLIDNGVAAMKNMGANIEKVLHDAKKN